MQPTSVTYGLSQAHFPIHTVFCLPNVPAKSTLLDESKYHVAFGSENLSRN